MIDELPAVVRVDIQDLERQVPAYCGEGLDDADLTFSKSGLRFHPGGGDVGQIERTSEQTCGIRAAVGHRVHFQVPGHGLFPRLTANGDLMPKEGARLGPTVETPPKLLL